MAQYIKRLTNLNWLKFQTNSGLHTRCFSSYNKDSTKPAPVVASTSSPDYLLQNLKNATSTEKVLELVRTHHKIMNSKQLLQALRSLYTLHKYGNSSLSTQQITRHPDFEKLCRHLKGQAGMIELNETIESLKVVSFVGVPSNSTIVQTLLQLLRHSVNELSLQQIIFLDFLLKQFKSSPLVDGLLIALPIVFDVHLPIKLDRANLIQLAECLHYASKKTVSDQCVELIVNSLDKCIDSGDVVDAKVGKSIVWSICDMEEDEFFEPLLKKALNAMLADIDKLNYLDIHTTVSKLLYKYSTKFPFYYDDVFVDYYANYIVDHDLGFEEAVYTLRKLSRVNYATDNLLNYVSTKCYENPNLLLEATALHMYCIATAVALTEFRPIHWDIIREALLETKCFKDYNKQDVIWIKLAATLCALDIYKFDVLEKALDENSVQSILSQQFFSDCDNFLLINQAICTFQPDFKHLLPSRSVIKDIMTKVKPVIDYPLEIPLQKALGGENYVQTCIKSELGHHIDHVVVMRKGGYPVSLSKHSQNLEEMEIPFDSQMILILALGRHHYTLNSKQQKATTSLMVKTLEAKGYAVVTICIDLWNSLADFEKIPYVMQAIKLKTENNTQVASGVC